MTPGKVCAQVCIEVHRLHKAVTREDCALSYTNCHLQQLTGSQPVPLARVVGCSRADKDCSTGTGETRRHREARC